MPSTRRRTVLAAAAAAAAVLIPLSAQTASAIGTPLTGAVDSVHLGCNIPVGVGENHCYARALAGPDGRPFATAAAPAGLGPNDLKSAYNLGSAATASGATVAIVDAYDDPNAAADLATYRSTYGLPACTVANGCFKKVNQNGTTSPLPSGDQGWATEISLDLDAVSATCPLCKIVLVEANSNSNADLYAAEDAAARLGTVISNSYGGAEASSETAAASDGHFNHPGIPITVSSGDDGYGVEYPAASQYVTAVGGTSLTKASNARGWTEAAWSGAGSGCSAYEPKPSWQADSGCAKRTVADVSAVADPNTGLAVYDSYCSGIDKLLGNCFKGWGQVGGTSLSAPVVASVYAMAGNHAAPSFPYAHTGSIFDVTSGSNGSCSGSYLCTGTAGYDGPTGLGSPNGTGAF